MEKQLQHWEDNKPVCKACLKIYSHCNFKTLVYCVTWNKISSRRLL